MRLCHGWLSPGKSNPNFPWRNPNGTIQLLKKSNTLSIKKENGDSLLPEPMSRLDFTPLVNETMPRLGPTLPVNETMPRLGPTPPVNEPIPRLGPTSPVNEPMPCLGSTPLVNETINTI